jgi:hypothetical protein
MIRKEKKEQPLLQEHESAKEIPLVLDDNGEICKGQCGTTHLCRDCQLEKDRLHEEKLNRKGRSDDKKE